MKLISIGVIHVKIYTYADDLTIVSQHPLVDEAAIQL